MRDRPTTPSSAPAAQPPVQPIDKRRLSERIVDQLRTGILAGTWKPGEFLPPERELSQQLGVTRVSLREALRVLEREDLIETRHGEGSLVKDFMTGAGLQILKYLFETELPQAEILRSALEFRALVGTELVRLAADRARPAHLDALTRILDEEAGLLDDHAAMQRKDFEFFETLADASGNIVIRLLLNSVRQTYLDNAGMFALLTGEPREIRRYHRDILAAVRARKGVRAARLAREYMTLGMERFFEREPDENQTA